MLKERRRPLYLIAAKKFPFLTLSFYVFCGLIDRYRLYARRQEESTPKKTDLYLKQNRREVHQYANIISIQTIPGIYVKLPLDGELKRFR